MIGSFFIIHVHVYVHVHVRVGLNALRHCTNLWVSVFVFIVDSCEFWRNEDRRTHPQWFKHQSNQSTVSRVRAGLHEVHLPRLCTKPVPSLPARIHESLQRTSYCK